MKTSITYNENPGSISEDEDFAQWFFEDKKTGYDVQYAAAAVMMFRYYGIHPVMWKDTFLHRKR